MAKRTSVEEKTGRRYFPGRDLVIFIRFFTYSSSFHLRQGILAVLLIVQVLPGPAFAGGENRSPDEVDRLLLEGEEAFYRNDLDAARELFSSAREKDLNNPRTWNYLGGIHFRRQDYFKALLSFKQALLLDPEDVKVYNNLGSTYERLRQYGQAEELYLKAIAIDRSYPESYRNLGIVYARNPAQQEEARRAWETYLELALEGEGKNNIRLELERLR